MSNLEDILKAVDDFVNGGGDGGCSTGGGDSSQGASAHILTSKGINHRYEKLHPNVRPYAMMTSTCYMEFNPAKPKGRIPGIFARSISTVIGESVYLEDVHHNQIQVCVERKNGKMYFTQGWHRLGDFYGIRSGAWVTILYITPFVLHIRINKTDGGEVTYPRRSPPHKLLLSSPFGEESSSGPIPLFAFPTTYTHILHKTLTSADVETGTLILPWEGFCQSAFSKEGTNLTLVDWFGNVWNKCNLQFDCNSGLICKVGGQWRDICKVHRLVKDVTIKLGVTKQSDNETAYFMLSPCLGVQTTLVAPSPFGSRTAFYQAQHFFTL